MESVTQGVYEVKTRWIRLMFIVMYKHQVWLTHFCCCCLAASEAREHGCAVGAQPARRDWGGGEEGAEATQQGCSAGPRAAPLRGRSHRWCRRIKNTNKPKVMEKDRLLMVSRVWFCTISMCGSQYVLDTLNSVLFYELNPGVISSVLWLLTCTTTNTATLPQAWQTAVGPCCHFSISQLNSVD